MYELEEDKTFHLMRSLAQAAFCSGLTDPSWIAENPEHAIGFMHGTRRIYGTIRAGAYGQPETTSLEQLNGRRRANHVCIDPITAAARGKPG